MSAMDDKNTVILNVDMAELARAISFTKTYAAANDLDTSVERKVMVVMDDVLMNIVSYGFDDPSGHEIRIEFALKPQRLDVVVTDDGRAFDPLSHPLPDMAGGFDNVEIGGLGLVLIRRLADDVQYRRRADQNILTFSFRTVPESESD